MINSGRLQQKPLLHFHFRLMLWNCYSRKMRINNKVQHRIWFSFFLFVCLPFSGHWLSQLIQTKAPNKNCLKWKCNIDIDRKRKAQTKRIEIIQLNNRKSFTLKLIGIWNCNCVCHYLICDLINDSIRVHSIFSFFLALHLWHKQCA